MGKKLFYWELAGFLSVSALGTLLHFVYDWSGGSSVAAAFSAVNESTWEHMKLLFFPMFFFSVIQVCAMGRNYPNFLAVRAVSTLTGLVLIPILFYTYTGVWGRSVDWINIAIFFLAALGAFLLDKDDPSRILARTREPILQPEAEYERNGFFGNVVFTCGCLLEGGDVVIYYGAADDKICRVDIPLQDIFDAMETV